MSDQKTATALDNLASKIGNLEKAANNRRLLQKAEKGLWAVDDFLGAVVEEVSSDPHMRDVLQSAERLQEQVRDMESELSDLLRNL